MKIKEYFAKKTPKQRVLSVIGFVFIAVFTFFIFKGNIYDKHIQKSAQSDTSDSESSGSDSENQNEIRFRINWLDIAIPAAFFGAYGIHKYREKKREGRL